MRCLGRDRQPGWNAFQRSLEALLGGNEIKQGIIATGDSVPTPSQPAVSLTRPFFQGKFVPRIGHLRPQIVVNINFPFTSRTNPVSGRGLDWGLRLFFSLHTINTRKPSYIRSNIQKTREDWEWITELSPSPILLNPLQLFYYKSPLFLAVRIMYQKDLKDNFCRKRIHFLFF